MSACLVGCAFVRERKSRHVYPCLVVGRRSSVVGRPERIALSVLAFNLFLALFCAATGKAQIVYGGNALYTVQGANLIAINALNPSQTTTIGATGLASNLNVGFLAYNTNDAFFYGLGSTGPNTSANYSFFRINPNTGATSTIANLGNSDTVGYFEAFEYIPTFNNFVVTRGSGFATRNLWTLSGTGLLANTGVTLATPDNDTSVYDTTRGVFYTLDGNDVGQIQQINLTTGAATSLGGTITSGNLDAAYLPSQDAIYYQDTNNNLYRVDRTNGGAPASLVNVGAIAGGHGGGLATITSTSAPEASPFALLALGGFVGGIVAVRRKIAGR